ncbi:unnamed protein product [Meganyctiphanes norvegica]|uniref:Ig-like domain-containing protein n=1 Tax=Meganyctiphanes norvegica TaxID=48144 RepID=A0AAV2QXL3_MEGNR
MASMRCNMSSITDLIYHLFILLLFMTGTAVMGAQITDLRVPSMALEGDDVTLHCDYDESDSRLYSLKWYKDGVEFYRHVPSSHIDTLDQCLPISGIDTKCWESSERKVVLGGVVGASTGNYTCEVIGDHPRFKKTSKSAVLDVYSEALEMPMVVGAAEYYQDQDYIKLNCTSFNSEYNPMLTWTINDQKPKMTEVLRGWNKRTVGLNFKAEADKFIKGVITVHCTAQVGQHVKVAEVHLYNQHFQAQQYLLGGATGCCTRDGFLPMVFMITIAIFAPLRLFTLQ